MRGWTVASAVVVFSAMFTNAAFSGVRHFTLQPLQNWMKVCGFDKKNAESTCYVTRDYGADGKPALAFAIYELQKSHKVVLRFLIPTELIPDSNLRFSIDGGHVGATARQACFPNGCFVRADVDRRLLDVLKVGDELLLWGRTRANGDVILHVPLSGFARAYEEKPIDPNLLARLQKQHKRPQR